MHIHKVLKSIPVALLVLALSSPALAGQVNMKKIKKWPALDQAWARSFDAWMSKEELAVFIKLKSTDERKDFLEKAGYWKIWDRIEDEMLPYVLKGEVIKGMTKDEVFMCWDKPEKIRKDFRRDAYVDVMNYRFEIDRKGREFLSPPDSKTAYKNESITRFVYMYNGRVFSIVYEGEEEDAMDDLPIKAKPEPPAEEPAPAEPATGDTPAAEPQAAP
jgi:hypothetical protein